MLIVNIWDKFEMLSQIVMETKRKERKTKNVSCFKDSDIIFSKQIKSNAI